MPNIRSAYQARERFPLNTEGDSLTQQQFADECDINSIMARYQRTGALEHFNRHGANYADVGAVEFQDAMNLVINARQMFNELPSTLRKRFHNDPVQFYEFVQDPDNAEAAHELGIGPPAQTPGNSPPGQPGGGAAGATSAASVSEANGQPSAPAATDVS